MELHCESVVNEELSFCPREGEVILLDIKAEEQRMNRYIFGYIDQHKVEEGNLKDDSLKMWQKLPKEWLQNAKIWSFNVYIKETNRNLKTGTVSVSRGILNIKKKLQLVDALPRIKGLSLLKEILQPSEEMFISCRSAQKPSWAELVQKISDELIREEPQSKIILINAPPGTGKTGVIIDLIKKI
ncbi:putative helicase senataxin [Caerostris extrusa]|uniref:Helicase senataxin n=1 Tax=Caerostris extrusa TaxID=172846 RepID=A0AAV4SHZ7_CAEEX|nr:putative helicase senataxin [Caerostris extrusa]